MYNVLSGCFVILYFYYILTNFKLDIIIIIKILQLSLIINLFMSIASTSINTSHVSIINIISSSDIVAKTIMGFLFLLSIWSWSIIIDKFLQYRALRKKISNFEENFWSGYQIDHLYEKVKRTNDNPLASVFIMAMNQVKIGNSTNMNQELKSGLKDRILRSMYNAKNKESEKIEEGLVILSTIGSASPFIGILGMVWSVMNNFHAIASAKSVSLTVIAPTMSEALFVTAVGIFVAIPASMFYNILITKADIIINKIEDFSTEVYTTISRSIDEGKI